MNRTGKFEKVSYEQFRKDFAKGGIQMEESRIREIYDNIKLPVRATTGSSGYDFFSPFYFSIAPDDSIMIPTGIKVEINEGWWLALIPRSSLGTKKGFRLANTIGDIDSDYYNNEGNEGHIFAKINNDSAVTGSVDAGEAFMQGIFLPYGITRDDEANGKRVGGLGSTSRVGGLCSTSK